MIRIKLWNHINTSFTLKSNATFCLFVNNPWGVCDTMMFTCNYNWHINWVRLFSARVIATTLAWCKNFFSLGWRPLLNYISLFGVSFRQVLLRVERNFCSLAQVRGIERNGSIPLARWRLRCQNFTPNLYKWACSQVLFRPRVYFSTKVSLKFLCSLHTRTNARSCRTTVVFEYRAITLRVFKRSTKIDCFPIIDDNFEIVLLDQKSKRWTCAKD